MSAAPDNRAQGGNSLASLAQSLRSGAAAPVVVLAMLSMVVVPLPPFLLPVLLRALAFAFWAPLSVCSSLYSPPFLSIYKVFIVKIRG